MIYKTLIIFGDLYFHNEFLNSAESISFSFILSVSLFSIKLII